MADLKIFTFGGLRFEQDGQPIQKAGSRKVQAMLVYLALTQRAVPRELLTELLWGNLSQQRAMSNLRRELTGLRQKFGTYVAIDRERVSLNQDNPLWIDAQQLQNSLTTTTRLTPEAVTRLEEATALYQGELLAGFQLRDAESFEAWLLAEREHWQQQAIIALEKLVSFATSEQVKARDKGIGYLRQLLQIDPLREQTHRQLMQLLALTDRRTDALNQYESCRKLLWNELGVTPAPETEELFAEIYDGRLAPETGQETAVILPSASSAINHNLPAQPTPFVGREKELANLKTLFAQESTRLLTIVGPGGMGKTRLALAFAQRQLQNGRFADGIYFVNLAPISEARQIVAALATALNYELFGSNKDGSNQQQMLNHLRDKQMLLIFDNFEHLLNGVALLKEILEIASSIQILVTSRERLQLRQEQIYPISGLEFPKWQTREDALAYTAVQLFMQSARRNQPDFALMGDDLTFLARICRLVAGMPLAIELAAAWVDLLSLQEIAVELTQGLDILETELRDMPERHRSIRAAMEQSWQRLSAQERHIFMHLVVFRGGFTREAAQTVAGANLRQLSRLVNKSFLQFERENGRYQIHELMRQFGTEKLSNSGQLDTVQDTHTDYFLNFVHEREADIKGRRQLPAIREITADFENVHYAWLQATQNKNYAGINIALDGLTLYFTATQRWGEAVEFQQRALAGLAPDIDQNPHPVWYRVVARHQRPRKKELPLIEQALGFARQRDDQNEIAYCLMMLGWGLAQTGNITKGSPLLEESIERFQKLGNTHEVAKSLGLMAYVYIIQGQIESCRQMLKKSLILFQEIDDKVFSARSENSLGVINFEAGDFAEVEKHHRKATNKYKLLRQPRIAAMCHINIVYIAFLKGQFDKAMTIAEEDVALIGTIDDQILDYRQTTALLANIAGDYKQASEILRSYQTHLTKIHSPILTYFMAFWGEAIAAYGMGIYKTASKKLGEAVADAIINQSKGHLMLSLPVAALLFAQIGKRHEAIELLALTFQHMRGWTGWLEKWALFAQLRVNLEAACGAEVFAEAWQRGQKLDLWQTAESLLSQLPELSQ
ncbi:MAG: BTAD domain-containing putative transcriptional regulator [Chloroflexota bacterium]